MPLSKWGLGGQLAAVAMLVISQQFGGFAQQPGVPARSPVAASIPQFVDEIVLSGLENPTSFQFAADGRIFVAEKSGIIKVFDGLGDAVPDVFADLRTNVHNFWDRGLLSIALHPAFPATPHVYVLYTHDAAIGGTAPLWGSPGVSADPCPDPPGATQNGCVASARLSRLTAAGNVMTGPEQILIEDWFQQYPSHSIGTLAFGADGALYVSAGEGASFVFADYGQAGQPLNPGGDPPVPVGGAQTPPRAEGGSLRSQDLRTPADPQTLDGTVLRVDPQTGLGMPDNPLAASADLNTRRVIAYGLRNPFRLTVQPGAGDIYVGDLGWFNWDEINHIPSPINASVRNFGWPCFEGAGIQPSFDALNLDICEQLYAEPGAVAPPLFAYNRFDDVVPGDGCQPGGLTISGLAFYQQGHYPAVYNGALFFADYSKRCIWAMFPGANGRPDPATRALFLLNAANPVDLKTGEDGDLFYADILGGAIHRIRYFGDNLPPVAVIAAAPTAGALPLAVSFDGTQSHDPDSSGALTFAWDFDGDGVDDSSDAITSHVYAIAGRYDVRLRVTDAEGITGEAHIIITAGSTPPRARILSPAAGHTWRVGEVISFTGDAIDDEEGALTPASFHWTVLVHHCTTATSCHVHPFQDFDGVTAGSFAAPNHEYPSFLEITLKVADGSGLEDIETLSLQPRTVSVTFASQPPGLSLAAGSDTFSTPAVRQMIAGSTISVSAVSPQTLGGDIYRFAGWSDGGAASHNVNVGDAPMKLSAVYSGVPAAPQSVSARAQSATDINISWSDASAIESGFVIQRSRNGLTFANIGTVAANTASYLDATAVPATRYFYRVFALGAAGPSAPSNVASAWTLPSVLRINYQPPSTPVPVGYLPDYGATFGQRANGFVYGWTAPNTGMRDRNLTTDQRYDTIALMQPGALAWELALPNGTYAVRIIAGDPLTVAGRYRIDVEGQIAIDRQPTPQLRWFEGRVTVALTDGRLTIQNAPGAINNRICFVEITVQ